MHDALFSNNRCCVSKGCSCAALMQPHIHSLRLRHPSRCKQQNSLVDRARWWVAGSAKGHVVALAALAITAGLQAVLHLVANCLANKGNMVLSTPA
jgi:hypothetical protein